MEKKGAFEQYSRIRAEYPAHILMFRMGGFYVMLEKDAYAASQVLGTQVIARNLGAGKVPACGVPEIAVMKHANKFAQAGYAVAICDETGGTTDGIKNRGVQKVLSPPADAPAICAVKENDYAAFCADFQRTLDQPKQKQGPDTTDQIVPELSALDLDKVSPTEAWAILYHWKRTFCKA
ncbi:MAG: hypothetical protein FWD84_04185 [Oscillospiraceae bacterium]|nr:hypothetical protein [Oscillospiraceae bacterium]